MTSDDSEFLPSDVQDQSFLGFSKADLGPDQLRDVISDLQKENAELRSQFNQAVAFQTQIQPLHEKGQKLTEDLREAKKERDDLVHRLEIAMEGNQDLTKQLQEERRRSSAQSEVTTVSKVAEIEKLRLQHNREVQSLEAEVQSLRNEKERLATQQKLSNGRVDRLLVSAERHFHQSIQSIDSLIDVLESSEGNQVTEIVQTIPVQYEKPTRKVRKLKSQLATANHDKLVLESAYSNLRSDLYSV
jgi:chromosome segregation ATPase